MAKNFETWIIQPKTLLDWQLNAVETPADQFGLYCKFWKKIYSIVTGTSSRYLEFHKINSSKNYFYYYPNLLRGVLSQLAWRESLVVGRKLRIATPYLLLFSTTTQEVGLILVNPESISNIYLKKGFCAQTIKKANWDRWKGRWWRNWDLYLVK